MTAIEDHARMIFLAALERAPDQVTAFLDEACGDNVALRARVDQLLHAHLALGSIHGGGPKNPDATRDQLVTEQSGTVIGQYKLLEQIGEGGFGVVYMAEQLEPVRRKVALNVLKLGMDTRQVVARFEAERQALAIMDHPNIAKVFDGGATLSGRPYFVMELVKGVPITEFCDQNHLTPRQRLELFVPVCQAVQHAHLKAIIHRDLKPSNVIVSRHDMTPIVKVIDFGVAKALGQELTDKTLFTGIAQMIGTPLYMSPEQAGMSDLDVDTRSDIYSLGVMLYELLTGTTPFSKERFKQAAYDEIRRIIREEDPPKPSTRLTNSKDSLPSISAQRHTEPARLMKLVRGELDWIVMKCLEKDRNRRYETANGFAADVQRYLNDEPVQACPPSAGYRLRKFVRRNKRTLATATILVVMLLGAAGVVAEAVGRAARDRAVRQARLAGQVQLILDEAEGWQQEQNWPKAMGAVQRGETLLASGEGAEKLQPRLRELRKDLEMIERLDNIRIGKSEKSEIQDDDFAWSRADSEFQSAFQNYGVDVEKLEATQAADLLRARSIRVELAAALDEWAYLCRSTRPRDEQIRKYLLNVARAIDPDLRRNQIREALDGGQAKTLEALADSAQVADLQPFTLVLLAQTLATSRPAEPPTKAVALLRKARQQYPADFWINQKLGWYLRKSGPLRWEEAIRYYTAAVSIRPQSPGAHVNLGVALVAAGSKDEAMAAFREAKKLLGQAAQRLADNPQAQNALGLGYNDLGWQLGQSGKPNEAWEAYKLGTALMEKLVEKFPANEQYRRCLAHNYHNLDIILDRSSGPPQKGEEAHRRARNLWEKLAADFPKKVNYRYQLSCSHGNLAWALWLLGRPQEAEKSMRNSRDLDEKLVADFPKVPDYRHGLAVSLAFHAQLLAALGRPQEAEKAHRNAHDLFDKLAAEFPKDPKYPYHAARNLSVWVSLAAKDAKLAEPERQRLAKSYADQAMDQLRDAIGKGRNNAVELNSDSDLDALRQRADFKKLLAELAKKKK